MNSSIVKPYVPPLSAHPYQYNYPFPNPYGAYNGFYGGYPGYAPYHGYGYPYPGELRDSSFYPPGYKHVSPRRKNKGQDTSNSYLEGKKWNNYHGYNTEKIWLFLDFLYFEKEWI